MSLCMGKILFNSVHGCGSHFQTFYFLFWRLQCAFDYDLAMTLVAVVLLQLEFLATPMFTCTVVVWRSGSAFVLINEVNTRRVRLVLGWVTVSGFNSRRGTFISVCDQSPRSTQPGSTLVGRRNEYQPKGSDALRQGDCKIRYGSCVGDR